jgi:hypothetical protein
MTTVEQQEILEETVGVNGEVGEHEYDPDPRRRCLLNGHRLSRHKLSRSMPEHLIMEATAEHEDMIALRSSEIRLCKYPETRSLPPPTKFSKSQSSRLPPLERSCSLDSFNFLPTDSLESTLSPSHGANYSAENQHHKLGLINHHDGNHQSPAKMSTQLSSVWNEIIGHDEPATQPADANSAQAMQRNEYA